MDEKRSDSNPPSETGEKDSETSPTDDTLDAPTPKSPPNGRWTFVTQAHYDPDEPLSLIHI
ncbi:hypothetical protein, partial [Natronococcus jeotgali]|uniref:hypothetical protein n=1 Tax=Natronococcus jeotgali TaxID=413812 RepID=UPI0019553E32